MRPAVLVHATVFVLCCSLAYWTGARQSSMGDASLSLAGERPERVVPQRKVSPPVERPEKRGLSELVEEIRQALSGNRDLGSTEAWAELMERDPGSAWELLLASGNSQEYAKYAEGILRRLAERDPHRAHELVMKLPRGDRRTAALGTVLKTWAGKDPKGALTAATTHPETAKQEFYFDLAKIWAASSSVEADLYASGLPPGPLRSGLYEGLACMQMAQDVDGFCAWFKGMSPGDSRRLLHDLEERFDGFGGPEPDVPWLKFGSFKQICEALPPGRERSVIASVLMMHLKVEGPDAFSKHLAELETFPSELRIDLLKERLLTRYGEEEPAMASTLVAQVKPEERAQFIAQLSRSWAVKDAEKATAWAESLPEGGERVSAMRGLAEGLMGRLPEEAVAILLKTPGAAQGEEGKKMMENLVKSDLPLSETAKLLPLMKGEEQNSMVNKLASRWADEDLFGCITWIGTLPTGGARDEAVNAMVWRIKSEDPKTATEWGLTIGNTQMKNDTVGTVLLRWADRDAEEALAWLQANPSILSKETQDFVRSYISEK